MNPFQAFCEAKGWACPIPEYRFAPLRRWRFDWAFTDHKIAIEIQGGIFKAGRHVRGAAMLKEYDKLNEAAILGWRIIFLTPKQFEGGEVFAILERAISNRPSPLPDAQA